MLSGFLKEKGMHYIMGVQMSNVQSDDIERMRQPSGKES